MPYKFRVVADIQNLDGILAGLLIVDGYSLPCPDERHASKVARFLELAEKARRPIRATGTRSSYRIAGNVRVEPIKTEARAERGRYLERA